MAAREKKSKVVREFAARTHGIVLRTITRWDLKAARGAPKKKHYIGAYQGYAFGPLLGFAAYSDDKGGEISASWDLVSNLLQAEVMARRGETSVDALISAQLTAAAETIATPIASYIATKVHFFEFTVEYQPRLADAEYERACGLQIYPSYTFCQQEPVFVPASEANGHHVFRLAVHTDKEYVSERAALNIDAYAEYRNQADVFCRNQAGFTRFQLKKMVANPGVWFSGDLLVPNARRRTVKGRLNIKCVSTTLQLNPDQSRWLSEQRIVDIETKQQQRISDYIELNRSFYQRHPASSESVQNVTVFRYDSRTGTIPGCMFDCFQLPKSKEEYYLNCLLYACQRRYPLRRLSAGDMEALMKPEGGLARAVRVSIVMDMLCIYVNYCSYITDEVDHNDASATFGRGHDPKLVELIESFDCVRCRDASDCEDFTREILVEVCELKVNGRREFVSGAMQAVITDILDDFMFVSILCGVSKASMSFDDNPEAVAQAKLSGHECGLAIPNYIFFKALSRSDPVHPLLSLYSESERQRGQGEQLYVLEGTGNLYPEPEKESKLHAQLASFLYEEACGDGLVKEVGKQFFYSPKSKDNFYKVIITILAPEPFLLRGYRGFEYLACIDTAAGRRRGVPFTDLLDIDNNERVSLVECPRIPLKTFRAALRVDADNFPPTVLQPAPITREMEEIAAILTTSSASVPRVCTLDNSCTVQIKFSEMTREKALMLQQRIAVAHLQSICYPEAVKMSTEVGQIIGGYSLTVFF